MPTDHETNKAAIRRFHDATNSGDLGLISRTIDELFEPDALIRTPLPIDATGAQVLKEGRRADEAARCDSRNARPTHDEPARKAG